MTVFGVATALARNPAAVAAMREARWEIASHGLKWIDYGQMPEAEERAHLQEAIRIHTEVTGERPLGWYTGRSSADTLKLVMEEGGFLYSSDSYADDLPYWVNGAKGPHLIIPYTLDANDMRFVNPQGFASGDDFFTYLKRCVRRALCRRRERAENDVGRPALPPGRPARPRRRAGALSRSSGAPRSRLGGDAARHRAPLAPRAPGFGGARAMVT